MLRQRPHRDVLDPGQGRLPERGEVIAARGLQPEAAGVLCHGLAQIAERKVIEQGDVGTRGDRLLELGQRLDLDLD
jgi:hypothetical protein